MKAYLIKVFNIVFFITFAYLAVLAVGVMNLKSPISALTLIPFWLGLMVLAGKIQADERTWYILWVLSAIGMTFIVYYLNVGMRADWGIMLKSAYLYTMTGGLDFPEYYMRYPNNRTPLIFLMALGKAAAHLNPNMSYRFFKAVSIVVSISFVELTVWFIYQTAKMLFTYRRAFWIGLGAMLYTPFYLYALYLYTDTSGGFLVSMAVYFYVRQKNTLGGGGKIYSILIGLAGALIFHIKILCFIILIAIVIDALFNNQMKAALGIIGIMLISFMGAHLVLSSVTDNVLQFDDAEASVWEYPPTHWVMMGLNSQNSGGYFADDSYYTQGFKTYKEKQSANIEIIRQRLKEYQVEGTVRHILYAKQVRTWTDSCLAGDWYVSQKPLHEDSIISKIFSKYGKYHWICLIYSWWCHITIMFGIVLSAATAFKRKLVDQKLLFGRISLFGLFLFLSVWECNARYVFSSASVLLLVAADGVSGVYDRFGESLMKAFSAPDLR